MLRILNHYSAVFIITPKNWSGNKTRVHEVNVYPLFPPHKNNHGRTNRAGDIVALGIPLHNPRTHVLPDSL